MDIDNMKRLLSEAFDRGRKARANEARNAEGHSGKRNVTRSKKDVSKSSGKVVRGSRKTTRKSKGER